MEAYDTRLIFIKENLPFSLHAKKDSEGNWFIGYNFKYGIYNGLVWTKDQAEKQLKQDIEKASKCYSKHFIGKDNFLLNENKRTAVISIILDVSYEVLNKNNFFETLNSGNVVSIRKSFLSFANINRTVCAKRLSKRNKELALFLKS